MSDEMLPLASPTDGLVTRPLDDVVDSDAFIPRLLALLSNALVWRESMLLRQEFSLGTNDWRVLSALGVRPGSSATDVSEFLVMNKAVVSKAVNVLITRNLIASTEGPPDHAICFSPPLAPTCTTGCCRFRSPEKTSCWLTSATMRWRSYTRFSRNSSAISLL